MIINRFRIKIIINVFYLISCLVFFYHWLQQIYRLFSNQEFVKTKKFEKRNIMAGFRQLYFFLHGFPILGIFDIQQLITATPRIISQQFYPLNSNKGIRQAISQIAQFPGILAMPPLDKDRD